MTKTWDDWDAHLHQFGGKAEAIMAKVWIVQCKHCEKSLGCNYGEVEIQCAYPRTQDAGACGCGQMTWLTWSNNHPTTYDKPQKQATESDSKEN